MSLLFCIPKVNWLSWRLRSSLSSDRLGIYPWLPDPGQPPASPCGSFRTLMGASVSMSPAWHRRPCVNKHLGKGRYFRGWIIYSARLETLSRVKDLVACMFVSALDSKTWPGLICCSVSAVCSEQWCLIEEEEEERGRCTGFVLFLRASGWAEAVKKNSIKSEALFFISISTVCSQTQTHTHTHLHGKPARLVCLIQHFCCQAACGDILALIIVAGNCQTTAEEQSCMS